MPETFWTRNASGDRVADTYYSRAEVDGLLGTALPYFGLATQRILFEKNNTNSYPASMTALRSQDDVFIAGNSYDGLTTGQKADLLSGAVAANLGFTLS